MKAKPRETLKDHKMLIQLIQQHNIAKPQKQNIIRRILCAQQQWLPILQHSTAYSSAQYCPSTKTYYYSYSFYCGPLVPSAIDSITSPVTSMTTYTSA